MSGWPDEFGRQSVDAIGLQHPPCARTGQLRLGKVRRWATDLPQLLGGCMVTHGRPCELGGTAH